MSLTTDTDEDRDLTPCETNDAELWFAEKRYVKTRKLAIELCGMCPAAQRLDCLAGALERNEQYGIFGGLTPEQRAGMTFKKIA